MSSWRKPIFPIQARSPIIKSGEMIETALVLEDREGLEEAGAGTTVI